MTSKLDLAFDNGVAMIHDLARRATEWSSHPSWFEFATNNLCNLRCVMCAHSDGQPAVVMQDDRARSLLDQVLPEGTLLIPSANSEPLLGNLDLLLERCRQHDVYLDLYTNATLLDGERFRAIADRVYRLHVSFDSHIPEVYERLRVGAQYPRVAKNIREILPVAKERQIPVAFVFVMMSENLPHLAEYIDFIADVGGAEARAQVRVLPLVDNSSACADLDVRRHFTEAEVIGFVDRAAERALARRIIFTVEVPEPLRREITPVAPIVRMIAADVVSRFIPTIQRMYPHFCSMAAYYMKIRPDGAVFPCCVAPPELNMGNVHERSVPEIWNGEKYRRFRQRMMTGDYPDACARCNVLLSNPHFSARGSAPTRGPVDSPGDPQ
jgi:radical SAM protein with 4Fe4S-binding SPASM domain